MYITLDEIFQRKIRIPNLREHMCVLVLVNEDT